MKVWQKDIAPDTTVEKFTVGNDRAFDLQLAEWDVLGSLAHAQMLAECKLISEKEKNDLHLELKKILLEVRKGNFTISEACEDVHSQLEFLLTKSLGDTGKKIHTARSRNDQSLLCIKLFIRSEIKKIAEEISVLFARLVALSEKHKDDLFPGYTHLQLAMPSSFGLWFGAYAESLCDDLELFHAAYKIADQNPLGSAAGYGSSFPINRKITTELLGFDAMNVNSVYALLTRGKTEKTMAVALAGVGATLSKLAMDMTLFMNQEFSFVSFPAELTTGSSIMPHKKNPDVWELIRAKCNRLQSVPNEFSLLLGNLPSGYHRDLQLTKEILFPAITELKSCLAMTLFMLENISVRKNILADDKYKNLFTVDAINELVKQGVPFRDAYKKVGEAVEKGIFEKPSALTHTHEGSIGNLCNDDIAGKFQRSIVEFHFERAEDSLKKLVVGIG